MRVLPRVLCLFGLLLSACQAGAVQPVTDLAGGGQAFDNAQPSLTLRYLVRTSSANTDDLGEVGLFSARDRHLPSGWMEAAGQTLDARTYSDLFDKLGTTFGEEGDGTFKLPDLRGRTAIGAGSSPGLPTYSVGDLAGRERVTLTLDQTPAHGHGLGAGLATNSAGGGMAHSNLQPSLALTPIIAVDGFYPSRNVIDPGNEGEAGVAAIGTGSGEPFLSELSWIAHNDVPDGWMVADGSLLSISSNSALFSLLGTEFGGDGRSTFALPDLRGRAAVGADLAEVGFERGAHEETLTVAHLPNHSHDLFSGGSTGSSGAGQAQSNRQPTLGLTTVVALTGVYPPSTEASQVGEEGDTPPIGEIGVGDEPYLGAITRFGAGYAPRGFAYADGQELSIASNQALFSLYWDGGTDSLYGGDFPNGFRLPNLDDRLAIGAGEGVGIASREQGETFGAYESALTVANLPRHNHTISVPGDYNNDGVVDAADYTVWRDNFGKEAGTLPNDNDGGEIGMAQYTTWANNYGLPAGVAPSLAVPEPAGLGVALLGLLAISRTTRR